MISFNEETTKKVTDLVSSIDFSKIKEVEKICSCSKGSDKEFTFCIKIEDEQTPFRVIEKSIQPNGKRIKEFSFPSIDNLISFIKNG